ncbi:MAG: ABC transporter permease [Bacteroidales bacterium]|nr:ABC transporter permease [Bacteroidales bacterium]
MLRILFDIYKVFIIEVQRIFHDGGVILIFFVATLLYPLIFGAIYKNELVRNLPVAVVDLSRSDDSRRFIKKLDATPELNVQYECGSIAEAAKLMQQRVINGIFYFPNDYTGRLNRGETARVGLFCDMSSFLYYRSVYTGASAVLVDEMHDIQLKRYALAGMTGENAEMMVTPLPYNDVKLYSSAGGFTSFLVPALLVLVLHQTLFLGIGIMGGTARDERLTVELIPERLRGRHIMRVGIGRCLAYLGIYVPLSGIVLILIPHWFELPQVGKIGDLVLFLLPFLLSTIFFSLTVANFVSHRDSGIVCSIFFSVVLLFLSGMVWPQCNMPDFWRYFSYLFPYTPASQGFVSISSMGSALKEVDFEYSLLWIQTGVYLLAYCLTTQINNKKLSQPLYNKA